MKVSGAISLIVLLMVLVFCGPLLVIWALNTLFPVLNIPYTLSTWLAALLIGGSLNLKRSSK